MTRLSDGAPRVWRATTAGLCATLVGIGLARFAYTPLLPALITEGWFPSSQAAYLGAANLAGYLAGALGARPLARRAPARVILRAMMLLVGLAFFACAVPLSFAWFFLWRFVSGAAGGIVMVLAAPTVLPHVPSARRGLAGGAIFTGVGLGIAASGTAVPLLLESGLARTWVGLGLLSLLLTALAWGGWPADSTHAAAPDLASRPPARRNVQLRALYVEYLLNAAGLVPHMVFLVDFVARGLARGIGTGARYWVAFGVGAVVGPVLAGAVADRIGFRAGLRGAFAVQAAAVLLPTLATGPIALSVSSLVVGAAVPGIVPLVLGRVHELVPRDPEGQRAAWSVTTMAFALGQATAAYGFSFLFARGGDYLPLFSLAAACLVLALAVDLAARVAAPRPI
ncbi:MAG TPA: YbfB/YjiJ family MFS transporter [Methylomirabilota bacterium]